jgi:hypothetical protein
MVFNGRVHTNSDLFVGSGTDLFFQSGVTSAGNIYHRRKDGEATPAGDVWFMNSQDIYKRMIFDSDDNNWKNRALAQWDGRVKDQAHNILSIGLPLPSGVSPIEIIKRGDIGDSEALVNSRMYYKADLRIIDGVATDSEGNWVSLSDDDFDMELMLSTQTIYNHRDGKWITLRQIDIGELIDDGLVPTNRILYISESETSPGARDTAIRLVDGAQLPAGGLTIASDNPLYIQGDYNVIDWQPASVMADALTILSNSWNDANSDQPLSSRIASDTEVRVALMGGSIETTVGNYNGGIENFPRFMEDWSFQTSTYVGSLICLWDSEWATGQWHIGGDYYMSPIRDWRFDPNFNSFSLQPPGSPRILSFSTGEWRMD